MNVQKVLEEIEEKIKFAEKIIVKPPCDKLDEVANDTAEAFIGAYKECKEIIRSHMDEVTNMSGKRLIDANALDDEVMIFFLAITGNPKQATVVRECKESFRGMIDEQPTIYADDGWIPVSERLPEIREIVKVTVHSSEWIGDYDSEWVSEEEKMYHPEEYHVHDGYLSENGVWMFYDNKYSENICEKKFGTNKGRVYDVVTAWQSLPEPYKGGE